MLPLLPLRRRCRKWICPTSGPPFSRSPVPPRPLWKLLLPWRPSPPPHLRVSRNAAIWKSSRLAQKPPSLPCTSQPRLLHHFLLSPHPLPKTRNRRPHHHSPHPPPHPPPPP